jgi:hypothetical protein
MENNIELELRAEVKPDQYDRVHALLVTQGSPHSQTKRLSAMFFGVVQANTHDIRVRCTNGSCEVVMKTGTSFNAHDRVEVSQNIQPDQFVGLAKMFAQFQFESKVGARETLNFNFPGGILASLVRAGGFTYLELEKMASQNSAEPIRQELAALLETFSLKAFTSETYSTFCNTLTGQVDWTFTGSPSDIQRLEVELAQYI